MQITLPSFGNTAPNHPAYELPEDLDALERAAFQSGDYRLAALCELAALYDPDAVGGDDLAELQERPTKDQFAELEKERDELLAAVEVAQDNINGAMLTIEAAKRVSDRADILDSLQRALDAFK